MNKVKKICLVALCFIGFSRVEAQSAATYYTSMGNFTVSLTDTLTPITVDSFIARVTQNFYDGLIFHRVVANFVIQGGDPLGNGTGGPGYTLPDEFSPTLKNVAGSLAMANAGPNTGGSQFYINLVNNPSLNNRYTVFGMVTSNFTVVQAIGKVSVDANDKPLTDVIIDSIRMTSIYPNSVTNVANGIAVSVYPNPGKGVFTINLPDVATSVEVINMGGNVVYSTNARGILKVDLHSQATGLYVVHAVNGHGVSDSKVVVQ